jgi:ATP-binding cassette subfamily B protein
MVAFVGANGAGKTSLMNALLGVVVTDQGTVSIDGIDATNMDSATRLAHFGMLTQEFGRYEFTVREAVQLGAPTPASDEAIWAALRSARLHRAVSAMPAGLSSMLGQQWGGIGLSGGEWQRLALARIYLRDAPIWVLDEPTSSIDSEAEAEIFQELAATKSGRITIVVSHRAWTLRDMDVIHVMDSGRIVESGTYGELLRRRGRFSELFALQRNNE